MAVDAALSVAVHVVAGLAREDGGPFYSVMRLTEQLAMEGIASPILTVERPHTSTSDRVTAFAQTWEALPVLAGMRFSTSLSRGLRHASADADLIHAHGMWLMPNLYAGHAARRAGKALVVSPRGMVAPAALAFSAAKKRGFWRLLQKRAYAEAAVWHATSAAEAEDVRAFGISAPIAVIPNGIDLPTQYSEHDREASTRNVLFLSRLHPKKNLPTLIAAWSQVASDNPEWSLKIAGPDERGHRDRLEAIAAECGAQRIVFLGPVYGNAKEILLANADIFVLPTLSENFGIAVAEALAAGIPAIVTKGAPWAGLATHRCGWWIDHGVEPLAAALSEAMVLPSSKRQAMGMRGRTWMERDFGWDAIGREMCDVYRWVLGRADRPGCVLID